MNLLPHHAMRNQICFLDVVHPSMNLAGAWVLDLQSPEFGCSNRSVLNSGLRYSYVLGHGPKTVVGGRAPCIRNF